MPNSLRRRSTCGAVNPEYENMPRWRRINSKRCAARAWLQAPQSTARAVARSSKPLPRAQRHRWADWKNWSGSRALTATARARVRLNARAKTLIGNIDKRDEFTLPDHLHNALPLRIA